MVAYLTMILRGKNMPHMTAEQSRELRTLAEALDSLGQGNLGEVAYILMQRFKSREHAALTGQEDLAKHLELIPPAEGGLISADERSMAAAAQLRLAQSGRRLALAATCRLSHTRCASALHRTAVRRAASCLWQMACARGRLVRVCR